MELRISGDHIPDPVRDLVESLTNYGHLYFEDVIYDEADKTISIPISRFNFKPKKGIFRFLSSYTYDKSMGIKSTISIKNVDKVVVKQQIDKNIYKDNYVSMLFGLHINSNELFIISAEEDRGENCYEISIIVSKVDIEINDN